MEAKKRLFDAIEYQLEKFPKENMLVGKEGGQWRKYSSQEVKDITNHFSAGLLNLGVSANDYTAEGCDKIAIISNNRPEWIIADLAVQQIGAILIPLYPTTSPSEVEFILNDCKAKYIFVSNEEMFAKIKECKERIPSLLNIYAFDKIEGVEHWSKITALSDTVSLQKTELIKAAIPDTHIATIIYTSGTTGVPKGVMLSHHNVYSCLSFSKESFPFEDAPQKRALSFLPLNHIFEKLITYAYLYSGIGIYYAESLETIASNLQEIKPHGFSTVPRLLEKVFERIMQAGSHLKGIKRYLFFWAVKLGERYDNHISGGWWYNFQLHWANQLIFKRWREAMGGNIEYIATGGAACQINLLRIFNAARIPVYEGYGPTENSPIISINRKTKDGTRFGTVGLPINGIEVKLAADGEICVKGPTVMAGYYKRPDLTAEAIIDGWLHTGDIGTWVDGKYLKITDRKKELFKTSGGKYVAPQPVENKMRESPFIEQVLLVGADRKFVSALILPSFLHLKEWMKDSGLVFVNNEEAVQNPKVQALYTEIIEQINPSFNHVEQVKKFVLLPKEWSLETGEMTPKLSLKRKVIMEKYKHEIEKMYA